MIKLVIFCHRNPLNKVLQLQVNLRLKIGKYLVTEAAHLERSKLKALYDVVFEISYILAYRSHRWIGHVPSL